MAEDARVGKERLVAGEGVQIGAADTDPVHVDQRLARTGGGGSGGVAQDKLAGLLEDEGLHAVQM